MTILDITLAPDGSEFSRRELDALEPDPAAVIVASSLLSIGQPNPVPGFPELSIRWSEPSPDTGLFTIYQGKEPQVIAVLVRESAPPEAADDAWQMLVVGVAERLLCKGLRLKPNPGKMPKPPFVAAIPYPWGDPDALGVAGDLGTCLAVAYLWRK